MPLFRVRRFESCKGGDTENEVQDDNYKAKTVILVTKIWVVNGCKTSEDCQIELPHFGKLEELREKVAEEKKVNKIDVLFKYEIK